jgi:hypothetical protein
VLHQPGKIGEPEVDHFDPFLCSEFDHFCGTTLLHLFSSPPSEPPVAAYKPV